MQNMLWKKVHWTTIRYNTPSSNSVLLYVDEKGPITAKTHHGGTSWSSVQVKVEKAQKKGLLNMCLVRMIIQIIRCTCTQCYKRKTGKQFVDFIKRIDRRYNGKNIQNIFVVLDNLSVHKSKRVQKEISKCCPRIKFVFLLPVHECQQNSTSNRSKLVVVTKTSN